ncbi:ELKS/Rab6-interacting/CAST family member 1 isoform X2 [Ananas comosus]|uniref:ELKS/Rab6-interacting/CAST family member 1 isoform X2 n=1 Tax=Ananas comosus TaxID=4615 RepID=A0A6P5G018_ANACO|nr:ELKS/Rab6-interacting/CAST family member 1 isoform X2 [Ananas comosus]
MGEGEEEHQSARSRCTNEDAAYPMYFGTSCAFVALHLMSRTKGLDVEHGRWSLVGQLMLQGSAQLLGLLVARAQGREEGVSLVAAAAEKLRRAEAQVEELKGIRREDAKANEKVASIFAAQEQRWIAERKALRHQIQILLNQMRALGAKHEENLSDLKTKIEEKKSEVGFKEEALEEAARRRKESEEKLQLAEEVVEELKERAKKAAQDHSAELWKHKTVFAELISNQRQLESELARALRRAEAVQKELQEAVVRKEAAVSMAEDLNAEVEKLNEDGEQKDKILSAMMRKSKTDTAEKHVLLKEVKMSKAKKKQAELEMERWKGLWESMRRKRSSRAPQYSLDAGCSHNRIRREQLGTGSSTNDCEYLEADSGNSRRERDFPAVKEEGIVSTDECADQHPDNENDKPAAEDLHRLQDWIRMEAEKYVSVLEQRHHGEIEAFTEQMRHKDEKLEAMRWRLLSMELETKRLQSHIEGLDGNLSHLREENIKLETLLVDKEKEVTSLKEKLCFYIQHHQKTSSSCSTVQQGKITRRKQREKEQESGENPAEQVQMEEKIGQEREDQKAYEETKLAKLESEKVVGETIHDEKRLIDITSSSSMTVSVPNDLNSNDQSIVYINKSPLEEPKQAEKQLQDQIRTSQKEEIEEEKEVGMDIGNAILQKNFQEDIDGDAKLSPIGSSLVQSAQKSSSWKMDIHALGVSYKIKRLKQQLLVLEKMAGTQAMKQPTAIDDSPRTPEGWNDDGKMDQAKPQQKGFHQLMSFLNKQVKRYQSLEEKIDDLCRRMESYRSGIRRDLRNGRPKEQTETLEGFLEESFQLQRYMVATGQKLLEMQSRITFGFAGTEGFSETMGFNIRQFSDVVKTLFRDIQRGLDVRIARIIGDLEGTLACDGILNG